MARTYATRAPARQLDDGHAEAYNDVYRIITGERLVPDRAPENEFRAFHKEKGKRFVQTLAQELLAVTRSDIVLNVLLKNLELIARWGKWRVYASTEKVKMKAFQTCAVLVANRALSVAEWLLALELPPLIDVKWDRIAILCALLKQKRSNANLEKLGNEIQAIKNARSLGAVTDRSKIKGKESRKRSTPGADPIWFGDAIAALLKHEYRPSLRSLAIEIGVDVSTLSRCDRFKKAWRHVPLGSAGKNSRGKLESDDDDEYNREKEEEQ